MQEQKNFIFITSRIDHDPLIYKSEKIQTTQDFNLLDTYLSVKKYAGLDTEYNNEGRLYIADVLLLSIGNSDTRFVLDWTCSLQTDFIRILKKYSHLLYFLHNGKADLNVLARYGLFFPNIFDTMIGEQRIGLGKVDMTANLKDTTSRRLNKFRDNKEIGIEFLTMTITSKFLYKHVYYSGEDIEDLVDIGRVQRNILQSFNSYDWFNNVENKLTPILSQMELEGLTLNESAWKVILEKKKIAKAEKEVELDQYLHKSGKFKINAVLQPDLFGTNLRTTGKHIKHFNYASPQQVLKAIKKLGFVTPFFKDKGERVAKPSVREDAIKQYMIENPGSGINEFLEKLLNHKEYSKFISSYGLKFLQSTVKKKTTIELGYKNPVTNKVHTYYKQCETETGRLASGRAKEGYFNSQQLPGEEEIRNAFTLTQEEIDNDVWITTCDLSGAELIIMAALADDQHLYELGSDDLHSPIATKCWRAIYNYRYEEFLKLYGLESYRSADISNLNKYFTIKDSKNKSYVLTQDITITKKINDQLRTDAKPNTFGGVYGMRDNKCAQTMNVTKKEGNVILNVIRNEFPKTFKMVEIASDCAFADGYVVFNNRSNNRRWFSNVLSVLGSHTFKSREQAYNTVKSELHFNEISEVDGAARNARIQGTQADMIKECKVNIYNFYKKHNIPAKLLISAHDETVTKHKGKEFGNEINRIMIETCNKYLEPYSSNIRMGAEHHTLRVWTKGKYKGPII